MTNTEQLILDMRKETCVRLHLQRPLFLSSFDLRFNSRTNSSTIPMKVTLFNANSFNAIVFCMLTDGHTRPVKLTGVFLQLFVENAP